MPDPSTIDGRLSWPTLYAGTLVQRYKRFLADVRLPDGTQVTAHCANSGRMTACCQPGRPVWLSCSDNPRRKLAYTWELIEMPESLVGVNTQVPNRLVAAAVSAGKISSLAGYPEIQREVVVTKGSRLDLLLTHPDRRRCYVEVKNCTLVSDGKALFPDAPTIRGRKHLRELEQLVAKGHRCVMFFLIQRMDAQAFSPADTVDPAYGEALRRAASSGVEMLAYDVTIDLKHIGIHRQLPCRL